MGKPDTAALLHLAESIADGGSVDWETVESAASPANQVVIRQLRVIANVAALHRTEPPDLAATTAAPVGNLATAKAPAIGHWGHLVLIHHLGRGTFGDVYRAWDSQLERDVALKLLRPGVTAENPATSRIAMEGRLLARIDHPNVITVHGVAIHEERVGLWMELVRGATLEHRLVDHGPLGAREAAVIGIDLCRALAAIHAAGLIHRDIKAQNVMREEGGRIVLMDLGAGCEAGPGRASILPDWAGTPLYLAPEVFAGAAASPRSDLYSLGVLLYHLVTGSFPVRASTVEGLQAAHASGTAIHLRDARADLPTAFVHLVDRATSKDPVLRYDSAGALEADLIKALDSPDVSPLITESATTSRRRRYGLIAAGLAGLVALAIFAGPVRESLTRRDPPTAAPGGISVLAVLPFQNLSADAGEAYLASAVPMELTARLGRIGALKVVPWTFMKRFDGLNPQSLKDIAQRTGADAVVEGAVMAVPGGTHESRAVSVRVQVYEASTGTQLWSSSFERSLGDFFPLQAEIAAEIADRVHVVLAAREQTLVSASRQVAAPAMEDYLRARQLLEGEMDLEGAITLFLRATRSAPEFAEAYVGLSSCYALQNAYFGHVPAPVALKRALDASNRAIALDTRLPEAWAARAFARFALEGNWAAAEADFTRAMDLGPTSVDVLATYSNYLTDRGRHDEAIAISRQAEERAPFSAAASRQVAWAYYMARQFDNAIRQSRRTLEIEPGFAPARTVLGRALLFTGRSADGISELEAVGRDEEAMLAAGYAMAGRRDDAERLLNRILSSSYDRPVVPYSVALIYVALGDWTHAMDWLEATYREQDSSLTQLAVDPMLDSIRSNERFRALLARVNERQ